MTSADRQSLNSIQRKKGGDVVCIYHDDAAVVMFCKTCDQLVCDECIKTSHKPHDLEGITKQGIEDRAQLSQQIPLVKNTTIPGLKEHIKTISQTKEKSGKDFEQLVNKIITRTDELIKMIEKSRDQMVQMCRKDNERARIFLSELEEKMSNGIKALEQSVAAAEEVVRGGNTKGAALIQTRLRLNYDIQEYKKRHAMIEIPEFVSGSSYDNSIEQMIGAFSGALHLKTREELLSKNLFKARHFTSSKIRPNLVAALPLKFDIRCATSVKNDMLIVPVTRKRLLITMASNGQTRETEMSDHRIYDMSHSIGNEFVATDADNKTIIKIRLDGTVVDEKELRSIPRGIHVCKNGDILMCQCDSVDFRTMKSKGRVVRMDEKLKLLDSSYLNKSVDYTIPDRIVQSDHGEICVIDRTGGGNSRLCVLNKDGSLKFVYPHESADNDGILTSPAKKISLSDVCCDTFSNIFVADEKNNDVIVLNSDGQEIVRFSKILRKKGNLNIVAPSRIVLDRTGKLWIVMPGKVLVFDLYS